MNNINDKDKVSIVKKSSLYCRKLFESKVFVALFFTMVGVILAIATQKIKQYQSHKIYPPFGINKFIEGSSFKENQGFFAFDHDKFFEDFERMEEQMHENLIAHQKQMRKIFKENHSNYRSSNQAYLQSFSNEKEIIFELNFSGYKPEQIDVKIENDTLIFSAKAENNVQENSKESNKKSYEKSDFYYSFSLPEYDKSKQPEIVKSDGKISVKLLKKIKT